MLICTLAGGQYDNLDKVDVMRLYVMVVVVGMMHVARLPVVPNTISGGGFAELDSEFGLLRGQLNQTSDADNASVNRFAYDGSHN